MRLIFGYILVLSMLSMNMEAFVDAQLLGHIHSEEQSHSLNSSSDNFHDADQSETVDSECGHCCHGHSNSVVTKHSGFSIANYDLVSRIDHSSQFKNFTQSPPTPPPNA